jgi:hypothetical protein
MIHIVDFERQSYKLRGERREGDKEFLKLRGERREGDKEFLN